MRDTGCELTDRLELVSEPQLKLHPLATRRGTLLSFISPRELVVGALQPRVRDHELARTPIERAYDSGRGFIRRSVQRSLSLRRSAVPRHAAFTDAGRCHCKRCQIRSGQSSSLVARVPGAALEITDGLEGLRVWRPATGNPKWFCGLCGTHVFAGELDGVGPVGLRPGTLDPQPKVEARWHIWISSMPSWDSLPDDGLARYEQGVTG